jgi:hypothetical protein
LAWDDELMPDEGKPHFDPNMSDAELGARLRPLLSRFSISEVEAKKTGMANNNDPWTINFNTFDKAVYCNVTDCVVTITQEGSEGSYWFKFTQDCTSRWNPNVPPNNFDWDFSIWFYVRGNKAAPVGLLATFSVTREGWTHACGVRSPQFTGRWSYPHAPNLKEKSGLQLLVWTHKDSVLGC